MNDIKKGDIVGRKSYGKDIIFYIKNIIDTKKGKIALLRGITKRVEADSKLEDLELIDKERIRKNLDELNQKLEQRIQQVKIKDEYKDYKIGVFTQNKRTQEKIITGKILHLDGDRKYSEKAYRYYRKLGLNAIVKNIPEYRQPKVVYKLLEVYNPDILVITGHDRYDKKRKQI